MKQCHLQQPQTVNSPCPSAGERSHTLCPSHRNPGARLSNAEGKVLDVRAMCVGPPGINRVKISPSLKKTYYMIPLDDILEITTWWMESRPGMVQIQEARVWPSGERGRLVWCCQSPGSGLWCGHNDLHLWSNGSGHRRTHSDQCHRSRDHTACSRCGNWVKSTGKSFVWFLQFPGIFNPFQNKT